MLARSQVTICMHSGGTGVVGLNYSLDPRGFVNGLGSSNWYFIFYGSIIQYSIGCHRNSHTLSPRYSSPRNYLRYVCRVLLLVI